MLPLIIFCNSQQGELGVTYPLPLQIHVMWHPKSDSECLPVAKKIYVTFTQDAYEPLLPGIGIPVFFRHAAFRLDDKTGPPAPICVPDTEFDLRIALLTAPFVLDKTWESYLADCAREVKAKPDSAALIAFGLAPDMAEGNTKVVQLDKAGSRTSELLVQHVLLQACRLLGRRPRTAASESRGAAPMKLFLSHTKRDTIGLEAAQALKKYFDDLAVERFFDEVSIQPGDDITQELIAGIQDSALVAVRTDSYVASPWCRKELAMAKRARRPMVVIDALTGTEARSSPFLSNLPSIRLNPKEATMEALDRVTNFIGLEVLRFLHAKRQLALLRDQGSFPHDAVLLARPPEARDLALTIHDGRGGGPAKSGRVFAHPDPVLAAEEAEDFSFYPATLVTPTSVWQKRLNGLRLGISASSAGELENAAIGLSELHIEAAVRVFARQALAGGATLVYGGALSPGNLTEALFEMIGAYNKGGLVDFPPLINYAAWPWDQEVDIPWIASRRRMLDLRACDPPPDAREFSAGDGLGHVGRLKRTPNGKYALARSLSAMREAITQNTDARIVLGGRLTGFTGLLPGIVEEVLLAIRRRQPLYIAGGFGGAAHLVADAIEGKRPGNLTREYQESMEQPYVNTLRLYEQRRRELPALRLSDMDYGAAALELEKYGLRGVAAANGLTEKENQELFMTGSVDAAVYLTMKGLSTIRR
jgi:SLOG cluster2/TIR domain